MKRVLVLGASGMLGSTVYRVLSATRTLRVRGTLRTTATRPRLPLSATADLVFGVSADDPSSLHGALNAFTPQVVINCIGVVKQLEQAADPLIAIPINSLLPHQLAAAARAHGARLVHVSTDCVFSGRKGQYSESDAPDAEDLYGRSKLLGEVTGAGCLTLRTSIIGPEPSGRATGLLDWFLRQTGSVRGFRRAIFSGLPTVALAELIRDFVLPNDTLEGLYHVGAEPIDKFGLLQLIRERWGKSVDIAPCDLPKIDRSLDCSRFRSLTGFVPAPWPDLVASMYRFG